MLTLFLSKHLFYEQTFNNKLYVKKKLKIAPLLNIDSSKHTFIDKKFAQKVCEKLFTSFQKLIKIKLIRKYDKKTNVAIMHVIYSIIIVNEHQKSFTFLWITKLRNHKLILNKL